MISPTVLRAALAAKLRLIPAMVTLMGGQSSNIEEYTEELNGDYFSTLQAITAPRLLIVHSRTSPRITARSLWRHDYELIIRTDGDPSAVFDQFVNGIPSSGTQIMLETEIHANYHAMEVPTFERRSIPIADFTSFDYWSIQTGFVSKGMD